MLLRLVSILIVVSLAVTAQDFRATLQGTVTDPQSANVGAAAVVLTNAETG